MNLRDAFDPSDPCPCGSAVSAGNCCLMRAGRWRKRPANIQPVGSTTGLSNPECYAHTTNDCSSDISREHFISHDVLRCFETGGTLGLAGAPWQEAGTEKSLPPERLSSKILCGRYNQALSPLDAEAGRLFRTIGAFDKGFNEKPATDAIAIFSGEDIERWMLKTVCGLVASKHVAKDRIVRSRFVSEAWVEVLFGKRSWRAPLGMYAATPDQTYHSSSFSFQPKSNPTTGEVLLADVQLNGIGFSLLLSKTDNPAALGIHRPRTIIFKQGAAVKFLELSWQDSQYQKFVEFTRTGTYDGPSPTWPPTRKVN